MIVSYRDKRTRRFAEGERVKAFSSFARKAEPHLDQLDAATASAIWSLAGSRLEALKGDRKGQYSIRINDQWRHVLRIAEGSPVRPTSKSWTITRRRPWPAPLFIRANTGGMS